MCVMVRGSLRSHLTMMLIDMRVILRWPRNAALEG